MRQTVAAAFEAMMLLRCAQPGPGRAGVTGTTGSRWPKDVFAEFSRPAPANRLVALLAALGHPGMLETRTVGIRWRRSIYQVGLAPQDRVAAGPILAYGWRAGLRLLLQAPGGYLAPHRRRQREQVAVAAWRAAQLAAGYRRRKVDPGLYIGDSDTVVLLVRAARLLDLEVTVQRRTGCHLLRVSEPALALLTVTGNGRNPESRLPQRLAVLRGER